MGARAARCFHALSFAPGATTVALTRVRARACVSFSKKKEEQDERERQRGRGKREDAASPVVECGSGETLTKERTRSVVFMAETRATDATSSRAKLHFAK